MVRGFFTTVLCAASFGCTALPGPITASGPARAATLPASSNQAASSHQASPIARTGLSARPQIGFPEQPALTAPERASLEQGWLVPRPMRFTDDGQAYVGGVAYQLVHATPSAVLASLEPSDSLQRVLPLAKQVTLLEQTPAARSLRVTHGKAFVSVAYTVDVTRDGEAYRFWLDPETSNDIDDVWGYLRVSRYDEGRSLITVGVALDLGPGIVRSLFEEQVRDGMLATAARIREFVEQDATVVASNRAAATQTW